MSVCSSFKSGLWLSLLCFLTTERRGWQRWKLWAHIAASSRRHIDFSSLCYSLDQVYQNSKMLATLSLCSPSSILYKWVPVQCREKSIHRKNPGVRGDVWKHVISTWSAWFDGRRRELCALDFWKVSSFQSRFWFLTIQRVKNSTPLNQLWYLYSRSSTFQTLEIDMWIWVI
jgi:hypothetical protein